MWGWRQAMNQRCLWVSSLSGCKRNGMMYRIRNLEENADFRRIGFLTQLNWRGWPDIQEKTKGYGGLLQILLGECFLWARHWSFRCLTHLIIKPPYGVLLLQSPSYRWWNRHLWYSRIESYTHVTKRNLSNYITQPAMGGLGELWRSQVVRKIGDKKIEFGFPAKKENGISNWIGFKNA